jgi:hypothetical protein
MCGSSSTNLRSIAAVILKYFQQISDKFVEILRCERELLVSGSGLRVNLGVIICTK